VCQWNVFQYSPTDQVADVTNDRFFITDAAFEDAKSQWQRNVLGILAASKSVRVDFRSVRARLGQYLLINSDGEAWLPDAKGRTIRLGNVFDHENEIIENWRSAVMHVTNSQEKSVTV
jgi:hypothetical protein